MTGSNYILAKWKEHYCLHAGYTSIQSNKHIDTLPPKNQWKDDSKSALYYVLHYSIHIEIQPKLNTGDCKITIVEL